MYLYCSQDQGALNTNWGCSVYVDVCAKGVDTSTGATGTVPVNPPSNPLSNPLLRGVQSEKYPPNQKVITVIIENNSAFNNTFELYDNVCKLSATDKFIAAHKTATLFICVADTGYGSFKARQKGNQIWNNFDLVKNRESRSLN